MINALVSCVVPVFNGEQYLTATLDSIAAQSYRPIETIVVDDGSTDASAELAAGHPAVSRVYRQENAGPAAARNAGVSLVAGEFLAFLDADDLWHPDKIGRQIGFLLARPDLGYCVTRIQNFWVDELASERDRLQDTRLGNPVAGYNAPTLVVRARTFRAVGPFDASMAHTSEPDWFVRASASGVLGDMLPEVLVRRRLHQSNRSRVRSARSVDEYLHFVKDRLDRARQRRRSAEAAHPDRG